MNMQQLVYKAIGTGLNLAGLISPKWAGKRAFRLFTTAPAPVIRPKEQAFLDTARQQTASHSGRDTVEYHWGAEDAPYILLSYGWGYNAGRWRYFVPALVQAGYRVIAYDPPGHGLASRKRLHFVDNLNIIKTIIENYGQPEALIAHSFGGACSVQAMDFLPKSLHPKRMVVMGAFSNARSGVFLPYQKGLGLTERVYQQFENHIKLEAGEQLRPFHIAPFTAELAHIAALIVHDPLDKVTAGTEAQGYHAYWPGSALYLPVGAQHHLGTSRVTKSILDFVLKGTLPQTATVQERPLPRTYELSTFYQA